MTHKEDMKFKTFVPMRLAPGVRACYMFRCACGAEGKKKYPGATATCKNEVRGGSQ